MSILLLVMRLEIIKPHKSTFAKYFGEYRKPPENYVFRGFSCVSIN